MDAALRATVESVLAALPASLEMPAGTGKTHIVAGLAAVASETDGRVLILTHTHAGVDAIRRRLKTFGVPPKQVWVDTITGWAFDLVRAYPKVAGVEVPATPDWTKSSNYIAGAVRVAQSQAIRAMHAASFDYLIVDEYQDCNTGQHDLVLALISGIPKACVSGDRLQGIFAFGGQVLVDWDQHVFPNFPAFELEHVAHRWAGHNEPLGAWLLGIRPALLAGSTVDIAAAAVSGLQLILPGQSSITSAALAAFPPGETVLVLGQWAPELDELASKLNGEFTVMEELQGKTMANWLTRFDGAAEEHYAALIARYAKDCFVGLAGIDQPVMKKLMDGAPVAHLQRDGIADILTALDVVTAERTRESVLDAMAVIKANAVTRLYKREAWFDARKAISRSLTGELTCVEALGQIRDAMRRSGRPAESHIVSRTLLVKGLEYDHVIIADARLQSSEHLYVALTRGRKSLTVFHPTGMVG